MARCRLILVVACVLAPATAHAQASNDFTGFLTGFIGRSSGGDIRDGGWTPGLSIAVVELSGWGVELDLAHVRRFDGRFVESGATSLTLNVAGVWRDPAALVRPYAAGGLGLLRLRACSGDCQVVVKRTDLGLDAGGGVFVLFNETVGVRGDVRYFRTFQRPELPLTGSGSFDFWRVSVGAALSWPIR